MVPFVRPPCKTLLPPTPLEAAGFKRFSTPHEMNAWLHAQVHARPGYACSILGYSVQGRPITCVHGRQADDRRLRVLLVGGHHGGSEAGGAEALLMLVREWLSGRPDWQDTLDLRIVADLNPDGRVADGNRNANGVNLNRDYHLLSQPESRLLDRQVRHWQPHVVLDAHESASFKRKTLGAAGWLTCFEAQLDHANHPAVSGALQGVSASEVLQPVLTRIEQHGMPAQRYIKEIASTDQPLTHGSPSLAVFRNKAGILGALSFLLETRMDRRDGQYVSFRDIAERRDRQWLCLHSFLDHIATQAERLKSAVMVERSRPLPSVSGIAANYGPVSDATTADLLLQRLEDDTRVRFEVADHRQLFYPVSIATPDGYALTQDVEWYAHVLMRHGLHAERLKAPHLGRWACIDEHGDTVHHRDALPAGSLFIPMQQPHARLVPALLEPQAPGSLVMHDVACRRRALKGPLQVYRRYPD